MKKFYFLFLLLPFLSNAQDTWVYSAGAHVDETMNSDEYNGYDIYMTAPSPETITFKWETITNTFPPEWEITLCDYTDCFFEIPASGTMTEITDAQMTSGVQGFLKLTCNPGTTYATGVAEFYVYDAADYSRGDTVSFTLRNINQLSTPEQSLEFSVYPNPTDDFLNLNNQNNEVLSYGLFNISGSQVLTGTVAALKSEKIDLSALPRGIYFLDVHTDSGLKKTKKIIVK